MQGKGKKARFPPEFIAAVKTHNKNEALYNAIEEHGDTVDKVIEAVKHGANLNSIFREKTPLQWAVHFRKFERFRILCKIRLKEGEPANVNAPVIVNGVKMSLLHYSALKGYAEFVKYLAFEQMIDTNQQDEHSLKLLPIHNAAASGDCPTLDILNDHQQAQNAKSGTGYYCIHIAAMHERAIMVQHLLQLGVNVDTRGRGGRTPLHCAVRKQLNNMVEFLLKNNASKEARDGQGRNALLLAVESGNPEIVKLLHLPGEKCDAADNNGLSAMHIAAERNDLPMMQLLKDLDKATLFYTDHKKRSPIHVAVEKDAIEAFNFIVEEIKKEVKKEHPKTYSREKSGDQVPVEFRKRLLSFRDENRDSIVEYAVRFRAKKILGRIAELELKIDPANDIGSSILHEMCRDGEEEIVRMLLTQGFSCTQVNASGQTPVQIAVELGHIPLLRLFRDIAKFDFMTRDEDGQLPIHLASGAGQKDAVEWLLRNKGGALTDVDIHGRNCLFHAARGNRPDLISHLYNVHKMSLETVCAKKMTLMHHAVFKSAKDSVLRLKEHGLSLNVRGEFGMLPFHLACQSGLPEMIDFLIDEGVNKNATSDKKRNAWSYAAGGCHTIETFKTLERHQVSLMGEVDILRMSPMHHAAISANVVAINYFHTQGLSCLEEDKFSKTPLMKAREQCEKDRSKLRENIKAIEGGQGITKKLEAECEKIKKRIERFSEVETLLLRLESEIKVTTINEEPLKSEEQDAKKRERNEEEEKEPGIERGMRVVKPKVDSAKSQQKGAFPTGVMDQPRNNDDDSAVCGPRF